METQYSVTRMMMHPKLWGCQMPSQSLISSSKLKSKSDFLNPSIPIRIWLLTNFSIDLPRRKNRRKQSLKIRKSRSEVQTSLRSLSLRKRSRPLRSSRITRRSLTLREKSLKKIKSPSRKGMQELIERQTKMWTTSYTSTSSKPYFPQELNSFWYRSGKQYMVSNKKTMEKLSGIDYKAKEFLLLNDEKLKRVPLESLMIWVLDNEVNFN